MLLLVLGLLLLGLRRLVASEVEAREQLLIRYTMAVARRCPVDEEDRHEDARNKNDDEDAGYQTRRRGTMRGREETGRVMGRN